jgi:xanthine dehydrogenase accessory factor
VRSQRFTDLVSNAIADGVPFALAILTRTTGSSPQRQGAKALFFEDGRIFGTLGGGCLEAEVQDRARRALQSGTPAEFDFLLDHDFGWDDGLICGGAVRGLILPHAERYAELWSGLAVQGQAGWGVRSDFTIALADAQERTEWKYREELVRSTALWIAGSGHIAHALSSLAVSLDFDVTVFDDRPALASRDRFPDAALCVGNWEQILNTALPSQPCFGVVVTRGHQHDALALKRWIRQPFEFLAMIGSRRKRRIIFEGLISAGAATACELENVACPAGIRIGAATAQEIGVSIAAQLIQKRAERSAASPS